MELFPSFSSASPRTHLNLLEENTLIWSSLRNLLPKTLKAMTEQDLEKDYTSI